MEEIDCEIDFRVRKSESEREITVDERESLGVQAGHMKFFHG